MVASVWQLLFVLWIFLFVFFFVFFTSSLASLSPPPHISVTEGEGVETRRKTGEARHPSSQFFGPHLEEAEHDDRAEMDCFYCSC